MKRIKKNRAGLLIIPAFTCQGLLLCGHLQAKPDDPELSRNRLELSPTQCVSLTQGDKCHVDVKVQWQTQAGATYCLKSSHSQEALKCWTGAQSGYIEQTIVTTEPVVFTLYQGDSVELAKRELKLMWVYKRSGRSPASWRMF
ncbi:DUF3019 domain-containing protein [Pseudoalteromonas ardens]|uniref:DUF3019 domain-containing protein n=1 Tax=Pseudoalteromonas ardens TaxID=3048490 RepID=UPI0024C21740|nr:DUF3019 domain-containing protein [Pseudoalteromonas sp. R96]MDK1313105.1 DUF3019 domain-containing protein [Pseudoalteromonas sp. R96]